MINKTRGAIQKIHSLLEKNSKNNTILNLSDNSFRLLNRYPNGCCKITSMLVARFLKEQLGVSQERIYISVNGVNNKHYSHSWLQVDDTIIDLTAYQFSNDIPTCWMTQDITWHGQFEYARFKPYHVIMDTNEEFRVRFNTTYAKIMEKINKNV